VSAAGIRPAAASHRQPLLCWPRPAPPRTLRRPLAAMVLVYAYELLDGLILELQRHVLLAHLLALRLQVRLFAQQRVYVLLLDLLQQLHEFMLRK
jgi:hypothetical protein